MIITTYDASANQNGANDIQINDSGKGKTDAKNASAMNAKGFLKSEKEPLLYRLADRLKTAYLFRLQRHPHG